MKHFAPFVLLLLFFGGAAWFFLHPVATAIKPEKQGSYSFTNLKTGDLICRYGTDIISYMLQQSNPRKKWYSHCGILIDSNKKYWVVHIMGNRGVSIEAIENFCDPSVASKVGIYRYAIADSLRKTIGEKARALLTQSIAFDFEFDLQTNNKLYCSELVWTLLPDSIKKSVSIDTYKHKPVCYIDALHDSLIAKPIVNLNY